MTLHDSNPAAGSFKQHTILIYTLKGQDITTPMHVAECLVPTQASVGIVKWLFEVWLTSSPSPPPPPHLRTPPLSCLGIAEDLGIYFAAVEVSLCFAIDCRYLRRRNSQGKTARRMVAALTPLQQCRTNPHSSCEAPWHQALPPPSTLLPPMARTPASASVPLLPRVQHLLCNLQQSSLLPPW